MALRNELGFVNPIAVPAHEAILNIYYTASCIKKRAAEFVQPIQQRAVVTSGIDVQGEQPSRPTGASDRFGVDANAREVRMQADGDSVASRRGATPGSGSARKSGADRSG